MAAAHKKRVGQKIKQLREGRGWTQLQLATQIPAESVDASYISKWERGIYYPDEHLEALAAALKVTPGEIMAGAPDEAEEPEPVPDVLGQLNGSAQLDRIERKLTVALRALGVYAAGAPSKNVAADLQKAIDDVLPTDDEQDQRELHEPETGREES
jgi:transcriptional regulator with XRE-family HTH domain